MTAGGKIFNMAQVQRVAAGKVSWLDQHFFFSISKSMFGKV
jgi:hypothetical protein